MKVLIVKLSSIESADSATIRTLGLVKGLTQSNCIVDCLTIPSNCNNVAQFQYEFLKKINIIRTNNNSTYDAIVRNKSGFKKIIIDLMRKLYHTFSIYDYSYSIAKKIDISLLSDTEYDLVISSSDPKTSHIAVKNLIKQGLKYNRWIQYWGDPMALDITNKSVYPKWFVSKIEEKILGLADKIIYVSPFTLIEQKKLFNRLSNKMFFLPVPYIEEKEYEKVDNSKFVVGYFGDYHSNVRNIMPLYNACSNVKKNIYLNIVGNSDLSLEQTENIKIYPRGDILEFEKNSDLLVCVLNKKGTQIPGKIYHSAATNKPILVIIDGDDIEPIKQYLDSFGRFILCENKESSIENAIQNIMTNKNQYKPAPQFHPNTIAKSLIHLAEEL